MLLHFTTTYNIFTGIDKYVNICYNSSIRQRARHKTVKHKAKKAKRKELKRAKAYRHSVSMNYKDKSYDWLQKHIDNFNI